MNRSIEQALLSLLPTYSSTLPQPLVELASSLLAQSRHRASTLKAEEEIARAYACAHIACDRLKISLNLPPIDDSRPPIQPRIYKRLYTHLSNILPNSSTPGRANPETSSRGRIRTPSAKLREIGSSPTARALPSRPTPSKDASLSKFRTSVESKPRTPSKLSKAALASKKDGLASLPPWLRPTLRFLCKEFDCERVAPTIMAALDSIILPHGRRTDDEWANAHLTLLLATVFTYVRNRVTMPEGVTPKQYARGRRELLTALDKAKGSITIKGIDDDEAWEGWQAFGAEDIDSATLRLQRDGCFESDWAKDIENLIEQDGTGSLDDENTQPLERNLTSKADTMFQERYDFLSERRRQEYAIWKQTVLRQIDQLEGDSGRHEMEIDG